MGERSALELNNGAVASLGLLDEWGVANVAERLAAKSGADRERKRQELGLDASPRRRRAGRICSASSCRARRRARAFSTLRERGVYVAFRGNAIRIASHVYNNDADIDRLVAALKPLV